MAHSLAHSLYTPMTHGMYRYCNADFWSITFFHYESTIICSLKIILTIRICHFEKKKENAWIILVLFGDHTIHVKSPDSLEIYQISCSPRRENKYPGFLMKPKIFLCGLTKYCQSLPLLTHNNSPSLYSLTTTVPPFTHSQQQSLPLLTHNNSPSLYSLTTTVPPFTHTHNNSPSLYSHPQQQSLPLLTHSQQQQGLVQSSFA